MLNNEFNIDTKVANFLAQFTTTKTPEEIKYAKTKQKKLKI